MKTADVPDPRLGSCKPAHLHGLHNWAGCDTTHSNVTGASVIRSTWYAMQDSSVHASHVSPCKTAIEHVQLQSQHQSCACVTQLPNRVLQYRLDAVSRS